MSRLSAELLTKSYGATQALKPFSHTFAEGKITTVLGPSGSGKSTLLSLLAGLHRPDSGHILLDGKDITTLSAERRDFGLVFQQYALFPHLTVEENVGFGLRVRGMPREHRRKQVAATLERMRIGHLAGRHIQEISGGEQQRTAIARALAFQPQVLLMDEPLSALDAQLRDHLRAELGELLRQFAVTTVYITHDQAEALALGDELIILNQGQREQVGTPTDVYRHPATPFAASFLGAANLVPGKVKQDMLVLPFTTLPLAEPREQGSCTVVIRPEDMKVVSAETPCAFPLQLVSFLFLGSRLRLSLQCGAQSLTAETSLDALPSLRVGEAVHVQIAPEKVTLLPESAGSK